MLCVNWIDKCEDVTLVTQSDPSTEPFWPSHAVVIIASYLGVVLLVVNFIKSFL